MQCFLMVASTKTVNIIGKKFIYQLIYLIIVIFILLILFFLMIAKIYNIYFFEEENLEKTDYTKLTY